MVARVWTGALNGLDAKPVVVEVDLAAGLPGLTIVGLPDAAINESRERIKAALKNSAFPFPLKKIVINLAPADLRKEGTGFDLPVSVGILFASGVLTATEQIENTCFIGELSLEGHLRKVNGILSMALMAKAEGFRALVVPEENVAEASLVEGIEVFGLQTLKDLPVLLLHPQSFSRPVDREALLKEAQGKPVFSSGMGLKHPDFADIKGHMAAKRALEIAAAGGHNVLLMGPPGSGKSMLARAFPTILPTMAFEEILDVSRIYSVAGMLSAEQRLMAQRPFRSPHHSASMAGITGGGTHPKPGEITLAHRGVLFLDELLEFPRNVLEVLRQPLEEGVVTISRAQQATTFPAKFILMAALNPCPCGYYGDSQKNCACSPFSIQRYISKLSGPLLDRIDIHLEIPRLDSETLLAFKARPSESSESIQARVTEARLRQRSRLEAHGLFCNAEMSPDLLKAYCELDEPCQQLFRQAAQKFQLSARAFDRLLRLSRTIADLAHSETIQKIHLAEALQYRALERNLSEMAHPSKTKVSG